MKHFEYLEDWPKNVSHETLSSFERYAALLADWNSRINLVASSTLPQIWTRHFLDSAQLLQFIPKNARTIADLGSGAGFPGLVLAIMGASKIHLIESTGKKASFLRAVIENLKLDATVHQERIEEMKNFRADVIIARALAPLPEALKLSNHLIKKDSLCIFLKGKNAAAELTESKKYWRFDCETVPSLSDCSGNVLIIKNLAKKTR